MSEQHLDNVGSNLVNYSSPTNQILATADDWNKTIQILHKYKQNYFAEIYKLNTFKQSVTHRFLLTNSDTFYDYLQLLENSTVEKDLLYDLLIPTKSQFFLNPESWQSLVDNVIPQLMAVEPPSRELNCWVVGCGTGEEAYSLAILLDEIILSKESNRKVKILATDVSKTALRTGIKGIYHNRIAEDLGEGRLKKYFTKQNNTFIVNYRLRKLVSFLPHDLIKPLGFANINLICCRNTLIYFKPQYRQRALKTLSKSLIPKGFLFLGNKELLKNNNSLVKVQSVGKIYQKKVSSIFYQPKDKQDFSIATVNKFHLEYTSFKSSLFKLRELESELESTQTSLQSSSKKLQQEPTIIEEINQEVISANTNIKNINQELYSINKTCQWQVEILKELNSDLENLLRSIDIGVIFLDRQLQIRKYNSSAQNIVNFRTTDIGRPIKDLKHNLDCTNLVEILEQFLQTECPDKLEVKNLKTKQFLLMKLHCYRLESQESQQPNYLRSSQLSRSIDSTKSPTQTYEGVILTFVDISDRVSAEQTLTYQAFYDSLTGLPNRLLFKEQLQHAINRLSRQHSQFLAVLYLDLNGFKEVNDSLGHSAGDLLLIEVGHRLNEAVRSNDVVCRLGGDEFIILLEEIYSPEQSLEIASRIHQVLARPFSIESRQVNISTSIGIAFHSDRDDLQGGIETLMENADMAMYRAKRRGIAQTEFFLPQIRILAQETMTMKNQLRQAIGQKEFVLHYQPIFELKDQRLQGFETLVRWIHPERNLIYPDDFLPLLQDSPLLLQLERWIIEQACQQLRKWKKQLEISPDFSLSVNISPQLLTQADWTNYLNEILDREPTIAQHLTIELTETALIYNAEAVEQVLRQLRARGIKIALDDFGTGFSSISHVHRFPLDIIKIDRSFIIPLLENERSSHIVRSIIFMSQQMDLTLTAEGIETIELLQWLQEHNCQLGQGHFWSPSLVATTATDLLAEKIGG